MSLNIKIKWLIEEYCDDEYMFLLKKEIINQGMIYKTCRYNPFKKFDKKEYNYFADTDCVIFHGTLNLARQLQKQRWIPGIYCNFNNFNCLTYYSYFGKYLLNSDYMMLPLLEIIRRKEYIYNLYGTDNSIFIRPNSGTKTFTGGIFEKERLEKEYDLLSKYAGKPVDQILCIISSNKNIESEYRFVIINDKVISGSQYKKNDKLYESKNIDEKAWKLASKIASEKWQPDRVYTIDICKSNNKYYLLEINSFSCSGLYKCDCKKIVKEVSKEALKEYGEYYEI